MTTPRRGKGARPQLVGVIASDADLRAGLQMQRPPDLFELRLDSLWPISSQLEKAISRLPAPVIITARDPREGGIGNLSRQQRLDLLARFLPLAKYVDVELAAADAFATLLARAKKRRVGRILSYHNFKSTLPPPSLSAKARAAKTLGADIFKIATRTDTPAAIARLVDLMMNCDVDLPLSAMGIGELGAISRLLLARCGSVLNYAAITHPNVEGQTSLELLRSAVRREQI
jgi:3-dehydroquinate dehydratase I